MLSLRAPRAALPQESQRAKGPATLLPRVSRQQDFALPRAAYYDEHQAALQVEGTAWTRFFFAASRKGYLLSWEPEPPAKPMLPVKPVSTVLASKNTANNVPQIRPDCEWASAAACDFARKGKGFRFPRCQRTGPPVSSRKGPGRPSRAYPAFGGRRGLRAWNGSSQTAGCRDRA